MLLIWRRFVLLMLLMRLVKVNRSWLFFGSLVFASVSMGFYNPEVIGFYSSRTISLPPDSTYVYTVDFQDSIPGNVLFQVRSKEGYPLSYSREVKTAVCFDNKCRLMNIVLHWNITGRYLGFELPEGEYLSKAEHKPFTYDEYKRLHLLLADAGSPLATFSYNELVPRSDTLSPDIDAVSSPTSKNLLAYVVEGAAFTTYKLWHIVYGSSQREVSRLTAEMLSPGLVLRILESPDLSDKVWALNHIHLIPESTPEIREVILKFIDRGEYSLAERAIQAIRPSDLMADDFQLVLTDKFDKTDYSLKKLILNKLNESEDLNAGVKIFLAEKLRTLNGEMVGNILDIFRTHEVDDIEILREVSALLQKENAFISRQAFEFLNNLDIKDQEIEKKLREYKLKQLKN